MIFAPPFYRVIEHVDRRVLGAILFVDAVTGLPITIGAKVTVRRATLKASGADLPLHERSVQIQQTRSGFQVLLRAPFFDDYAASFENPQDPAETPPGQPLRLRIAVTDAGPNYLPQEFQFDLPRPADRALPDNVFEPVVVELFRAPGAPIFDGWSVLRVTVTQENSGEPLPGVLLRVFRSPRGQNDPPIGRGISEWRHNLRGEALVAVPDIPRFRPGTGNNVFETTQAVHLEATRDTAFTGASNQFPDVEQLTAGTAPGITRRRSDPPGGPPLTINPPAPLNLRAGSEASVNISIP